MTILPSGGMEGAEHLLGSGQNQNYTKSLDFPLPKTELSFRVVQDLIPFVPYCNI